MNKLDQPPSGTSRNRRSLAAGLTAVLAVGALAGWLLATVLEYLQWAAAARWTLHGTVAMLTLAVAGALATYVWRDESPEDDRAEDD